jgi:hypothetical protein
VTSWIACPDCDCCSGSGEDAPAEVCDLCRASSAYGAGDDGCPCDPKNQAVMTLSATSPATTPSGAPEFNCGWSARNGPSTSPAANTPLSSGRGLRKSSHCSGTRHPDGLGT